MWRTGDQVVSQTLNIVTGLEISFCYVFVRIDLGSLFSLWAGVSIYMALQEEYAFHIDFDVLYCSK